MHYYRNLILSLFIFSFALSAQQIIIPPGKGVSYPQYEDKIDFLVMLYGIDIDTEISLSLPNPSLLVEWFRYPDMLLMSNQKALIPDDHTGYIARISGTHNGEAYFKELSVWVIDYSLYEPKFNTLHLPDLSENLCNQLILTLDANLPKMYYETPNQLKYDIPSEFNLEYETIVLKEETWVDSLVIVSIYLDDYEIVVSDPPLKDSYFTLTGDQFSADLEIPQASIQSDYFQAIRVFSKIKSEATTRDVSNEGDSPDDISTLSASAPLDIHFTCISNGSVADYFRWEISKDDETPFIVRTGEDYRYTFNEAGTFKVKLETENSYCHHADSLIVKVSESAISAPNAFSPNGDGINDEFRVAYKSIVEFDCWIYNRWGQQVYHWNDPQRGWDGTVNGRPASEGAYFYVIRALGADGLKYKLKGDISLLRGKIE